LTVSGVTWLIVARGTRPRITRLLCVGLFFGRNGQELTNKNAADHNQIKAIPHVYKHVLIDI